MTTPLLKRTLSDYLIFAVVLILIAMPVFYFTIQRMFLHDTDEALLQDKQELIRALKKNPGQDIHFWNEGWERNITISRSPVYQVKNIFFTNSDVDTASHESEPFRNLSTYINVNGQNYSVLLRLSLADSEGLAKGIFLTQAILLIVLLAGLWWLTRRQSNILWRPFYNTLQALQNFELEKNTGIKFSPTNIYEFEQLNKTIQLLVTKNYKTYLQQKEFTENAAHEMQTPLAVLQSKIDILLQTPELTASQAEVIQSLSAAIHRLVKLNNSLSLLAKIENNQFIEKSRVNIAETVEKNIALLEDQLSAKQIQLFRQLSDGMIIHANPSLMDILFSNLLLNAIRHNTQHGIIRIMGHTKECIIQNTGIPAPLDYKIFDRFYKQHAHPQSTGLGLAIARQICEVSGFSIHYAYNEKESLHSFTITF
jgi:signal transduction histidine kinase